MRYLLAILLTATLAPPAWAGAPIPFPSGAPWFNVSHPLTARSVQGRFVLLDFFTPGCINCIETIPHTAALQRRFARDLIVIGVNAPKFSASHHATNVRDFLRRYDVRHPVVTDLHFQLWHAYHVFAWPTFVLIGPRGTVRHIWVGQGHHAAIQNFLAAGLEVDKPYLRSTAKPRRSSRQIARKVTLQSPEKIAISPRWVAVADSGANRILLFTPQGRLLKVIGDGRRGMENGAPAAARFRDPQGLAFADHALYVADTMNNAIRRISLHTFRVTTVGQSPGVHYSPSSQGMKPNAPWGLRAVGQSLYIAMAGNHQIWRLSLPAGTMYPWAGTGEEGLENGRRHDALFAQPSGLAYHHGILYVADAESSSVRAVTANAVHTLIGHGLFRFGHRNGPARAASLQHDQGLAYSHGDLYIADTFNNRVQKLDMRTDEVTTVAGNGRAGRLLGPALQATLNEPGGLAIANRQTLLIADTGNDRILALHLKTGRVTLWAH